jgi:pilus assembly protein Flp/PilA
MIETLRALWTDESGQDLAEYALLIALIALAVILAVTFLGTKVSTVYESIGTNLENNLPGGS